MAWLSCRLSDGRSWRSDDGSDHGDGPDLRPSLRSARQETVKPRAFSGDAPGRPNRWVNFAGTRLVGPDGIDIRHAGCDRQNVGTVCGESLAQIVGIAGDACHLRSIGTCTIVAHLGDRRPGQRQRRGGRPRLGQGLTDHEEERENVEQTGQHIPRDTPKAATKRRTDGVHDRWCFACAGKRLWVRCGAFHISKTGGRANPEQVPAAFCRQTDCAVSSENPMSGPLPGSHRASCSSPSPLTV